MAASRSRWRSRWLSRRPSGWRSRWRWTWLLVLATVGPAVPIDVGGLAAPESPRSEAPVAIGAPVAPVAIGAPAATGATRTPSSVASESSAVTSAALGAAVAVQPAQRQRPRPLFDLAVVGDSLTYAGYEPLSEAITSAGWRAHIDGLPSRSISYPTDVAYSAVDQVAAIKRLGIDPATWLVELGTNDLYFIVHCQCPDQRQAAIDRIRLMLAAIGPGRRIIWVGVQNFEYPIATTLFNDVLDELVTTGEISAIVDWESLSANKRRDWFVDTAHLSDDGYIAWVPAVVEALGNPPT